MSQTRIIVYGNAGSGKTTMARALSQAAAVPHLDLDPIAWAGGGALGERPVRRPLTESFAMLSAFLAEHPGWVIEGVYGDLVQAALWRCAELRFLNPGIEFCVANCRRRPWEPHKYESVEAQEGKLLALIAWVREYETRDDEYSLRRHREILDGFAGPRREYGPQDLVIL